MSRHWAADDGMTGWLKPDGSLIRVPPARLGVIGNGHHIKLGNDDQSSPWDQSFERVFDRADGAFPDLISWLESLERSPVRGVKELRDRFVVQPCTDDELCRMSECAVSLAVRGPMNREAAVALAEHIRGPIKTSEREALIGLNMRNSQRVVADSIGSRGKFVAIYSKTKEFVFGDGFFHNVRNAQMAPHSPKILVPLTPHISILVCRPTSYMTEPRLCTLVLEDHEVGVDPISRTPYCSHRRSPKCPNRTPPSRPIRRNFVNKWLNWCKPVVPPVNFHESLAHTSPAS